MTIDLPAEIETAMLTHAHWCHPRESCGLLLGTGPDDLRMLIATTNVLDSSTNYTIEPREQFAAHRYADRRGWDVVGVFHSHPHTEARPSPTDVRLAPDPTWLYLLVGMERHEDPDVRAFTIVDGPVTRSDAG